jgi:hypothetical protein
LYLIAIAALGKSGTILILMALVAMAMVFSTCHALIGNDRCLVLTVCICFIEYVFPPFLNYYHRLPFKLHFIIRLLLKNLKIAYILL